MKHFHPKWPLLLCCIVLISSCSSVKKYQLMYLNDSHMQPNNLGIEKFESEGVNFREGAAGGDGGHTGGGCGCN